VESSRSFRGGRTRWARPGTDAVAIPPARAVPRSPGRADATTVRRRGRGPGGPTSSAVGCRSPRRRWPAASGRAPGPCSAPRPWGRALSGLSGARRDRRARSRAGGFRVLVSPKDRRSDWEITLQPSMSRADRGPVGGAPGLEGIWTQCPVGPERLAPKASGPSTARGSPPEAARPSPPRRPAPDR